MADKELVLDASSGLLGNTAVFSSLQSSVKWSYIVSFSFKECLLTFAYGVSCAQNTPGCSLLLLQAQSSLAPLSHIGHFQCHFPISPGHILGGSP